MNSIFVKLKNPIGKYNELEIKVGYEKGGVNCFSGKTNTQGIHVYLKPVKRENGLVSTTLLGGSIAERGFKVLMAPLSRKSQKRIERIYNMINDDKIISSIRDNYDSGNFIGIVTLLEGLGH